MLSKDVPIARELMMSSIRGLDTTTLSVRKAQGMAVSRVGWKLTSSHFRFQVLKV
jgi:hypothetical protein